MAYREYIGSRYVPIFGRKGEDTTNWDNLAPYEPLTVVTHQGNSFISRQYVPTGIDITNTNYWVSTGVYNAQVEAYRQEVLAFDGRINANTDAIGDINTELGQFEETTSGNFTTVNGRIDNLNTALTNQIDAVNETITELTPSDMLHAKGNMTEAVFIGDSYTYGTGASDHLSGDTKRWSSIVCARLGLTEHNYAVGGTGFAKESTAANNFDKQLERAVNQLSAAQKQHTRFVFIAGGYNDAKTGVGAGALYSACKTLMISAYNAFPNALIVLIPMMWPGHTFTQTDYTRYINLYNAGIWCEKNVRVLKDPWSWLFGEVDNMVASDEIHPNDAGHQRIAFTVIGGLMGNDTSSCKLLIPTAESGFTLTGEAAGFYQWLQNGRIYSEPAMITTANTMTEGTSYTIGHVDKGACPRNNVYTTLYAGDSVRGIVAVIPSGSVIAKINSGGDIAGGYTFRVGSMNWLPYGKA